GLLFGADTLLSEFDGFFEAITPAEIFRAAIIGDVALVFMTVAWIAASTADRRKEQREILPALPPERQSRQQPAGPGEPDLSLRNIWIVVAVAFPLGIAGLLTFANVPGLAASKAALEPGEWQSSSYFFITQVWAGLAIIALIYWYGFRWWLLLPMSLYLAI